MAKRPVFISDINEPTYVKNIMTEFTWYSGLSKQQKQRSIHALHQSFHERYPDYKILEISSKSPEMLGVSLSAFNLKFNYHNKYFSVETAFQSSKVFDYGGPFKDLLEKSSKEAKLDSRLKNSGNLLYFNFFDDIWPIEPKTAFYDWLYINAIHQNEEISKEILNYSAFTDIEFNPNKSINCQAKAAALYVSLKKLGNLENHINSMNEFLEIYHN